MLDYREMAFFYDKVRNFNIDRKKEMPKVLLDKDLYKQFFCCSLVNRSLHLECIVSKCSDLCFGCWVESERYCISFGNICTI